MKIKASKLSSFSLFLNFCFWSCDVVTCNNHLIAFRRAVKLMHAEITVKVLIREVELTLRVFFSVSISKVQLHLMRLEGDQIVVKLGF